MRHLSPVPCFLLVLALGLAIFFVPARSASAQWAESVSPPAALTVSTATLPAPSVTVTYSCNTAYGWFFYDGITNPADCPVCEDSSGYFFPPDLEFSYPAGTLHTGGEILQWVTPPATVLVTLAPSATSTSYTYTSNSASGGYFALVTTDGSWTSPYSPNPADCL